MISICLMLAGAIVGVAIHALTTTHKERQDMARKLSELSELLTPIVGALQAAVEPLSQVGPQLEKAKLEIIAALGGEAEIPAEALAKLQVIGDLATGLKTQGEALKAVSQALDDLNPRRAGTDADAGDADERLETKIPGGALARSRRGLKTKTNGMNMKTKRTKSKAAIELRNAVARAETLLTALQRAQAAAAVENGLLAMVLTSRLESAAGLHRKLVQIRNCMG